MKKIFSIMLALACALFAGVACTPDTPEPTPEPEAPKAFEFNVDQESLTCGYAAFTCTPADKEMLYFLITSQELGQYGCLLDTPEESLAQYKQMLVENYMLTTQPDNWFVYQGDMPEGVVKEATRYSAEESVQVYAVGLNVTASTELEGIVFVTVADFATEIHSWEVPFLAYPTVTVAEADLNKSVTSAAGKLVIDCAVENPMEGTEMLFETDAAWVVPTWADGKLTLAYEANTAAVARRAKIYVSYGYYTNPFEITLVQEKNPNATPITLNVKVVGQQFNGIFVDVTCSDPEATYALGCDAAERDWNTGAELPIDWATKAEDLLIYAGTQTFHKGNLTNHFIKLSPSNYEWYGYEYYVWAVAVNATSEETFDYWGNPRTDWTVNGILSEVAVSEKTTIDVSTMPKVEWIVEQCPGLTWNENSERWEIEVPQGTPLALYYKVTNPVEGASLKLNGTGLYDPNDVVLDEPVVYDGAGVVAMQINAYDPEKNYHYVDVTFNYTNEDNDLWGVQLSVRINQVEGQGGAAPDMGL